MNDELKQVIQTLINDALESETFVEFRKKRKQLALWGVSIPADMWDKYRETKNEIPKTCSD